MSKKSGSVQFTVKGRGEFPYDMLRYDQCYPRDIPSSTNMHYDRTTRESITEVRVVNLETSRAGYDVVTPERWSSFGWQVSDVKTVP